MTTPRTSFLRQIGDTGELQFHSWTLVLAVTDIRGDTGQTQHPSHAYPRWRLSKLFSRDLVGLNPLAVKGFAQAS